MQIRDLKIIDLTTLMYDFYIDDKLYHYFPIRKNLYERVMKNSDVGWDLINNNQIEILIKAEIRKLKLKKILNETISNR